MNARGVWQLTAAGRTLARGEVEVSAEAGRPKDVRISISLPELKPGTSLAVKWTFTLLDPAMRELGAIQRPIELFARSVFEQDQKALQQRKITLFDPELHTLAVFEKHEIPHQFTKNFSELEDIDSGLLVVGEGLSLRDYPELGPVLLKLSSSGVPVVVLAPIAGAFPFPEGNGPAAPRTLTLARAERIRELDERLDGESWSAEHPIVLSSWRTTAGDGEPILEFQSGEAGPKNGWTWLRAEYKSGGRLTLCGWSLIQNFEKHPAPRCLLRRLLLEGPKNHSAEK